MKKRLLAIAMTLAMTLSLLPVTAGAEGTAGDFTVTEGTAYTYADGVLTITGDVTVSGTSSTDTIGVQRTNESSEDEDVEGSEKNPITVKLSGVNLSGRGPLIKFGRTAGYNTYFELVLVGENTLRPTSGDNFGYADGIYVGPQYSHLTISGDGTLTTSGARYDGAGIYLYSYGSLTIESGKVTAIGTGQGGGIRLGGDGRSAINITGGTVTASTESRDTAAIGGSGWENIIQITGGTVVATSSGSAPAIQGNKGNSESQPVTISNDATVIANSAEGEGIDCYYGGIEAGTDSVVVASSTSVPEGKTVEFKGVALVGTGLGYEDITVSDGSEAKTVALRGGVTIPEEANASISVGSGWTLDLGTIKRSVDWQLTRLKTDYIDFGFIHCIDEAEDYARARAAGTIDYLLGLKRQGVVRHIGMSSHTPAVADQVLDTGILDMLMFSINPAYDYQKGEYGLGEVDQRMALYRRCEAQGVGISVMKAFAAGQLLDAQRSPFGLALTRYQCLQYALDRPGVLTVLPGVRDCRDLQALLGFFDAPAGERDYSVLGGVAPKAAEGLCVYCNHCQPCPAGLDIGLINKYYDLARIGDRLASEHYAKLDRKASDCVSCGHCDRRCPFHVQQSGRMAEIASYFGR